MATPNVNPSSDPGSASSPSNSRTPLSKVTSLFLFLFERITPDPYVFAVALTILTALLAGIFAPRGSADSILSGWYNGLFSILAFAFQMVLVLVTGYALSNSPPVRQLLNRLACRSGLLRMDHLGQWFIQFDSLSSGYPGLHS